MQSPPFPPMVGPLIQRVALVDRITRDEPNRFRATSLPGHLLHFVVQGQVRQTAGGRTQQLGPGDIVWYFEDETVRGEILQAPWTFYTVNFEAPTLAPPPEHQRVRRANATTASRFEALLDVWRDPQLPGTVRHIRTHVLLLELLLDLMTEAQNRHRVDAATQPWWAIEAKLRARLDQNINLQFLESLSGLSRRKINEACELATGCSPLKRVKEIRLTYARGLVQHSELTISEIAYRVGYSRVQELSRDYRERFRVSPRAERSHEPAYRRLEPQETPSQVSD